MREHFAFKRCTLSQIQPRLRSYQKTEFQSCRELALGNRDLSKRVSLPSQLLRQQGMSRASRAKIASLANRAGRLIKSGS